MHSISTRARTCTVVLLACAALACAPRSDEQRASSPAAQIGYPQASWRADRARLNPVRLRIAHIMLGHAGTTRLQLATPFFAEPSTRTRDEALRLALEIASQLDRRPRDFARLAARHSEDRVSREQGGELGIVAATGLPATMLDALAVLKIGEISRVVESEFGFHIVKRLQPAPERRITARHIRIAHDEVLPDSLQQRAPRTRVEALALARMLRAELRAHPDRFAELARRHSNASDAAEGGELGTVSTLEGSELGLGFRSIAQREVGAISEPFETSAGYEIYQRLADVEPVQLVVRFISIGRDQVTLQPMNEASSSAPADPKSLSERLAAELAADPTRFDAVQQQYCPAEDCSQQIWTPARGRVERGTVDMIEGLAFGAVAPGPIPMAGGAFMIVRREDPARVPIEPPHYELEVPAVEFAVLERQLGNLDALSLSKGTLELATTAERSLALDARQRKAFRALFEQLAERLKTAQPEQRSELIADHQVKVLALIGPEKMATLDGLREALWRNAQMM